MSTATFPKSARPQLSTYQEACEIGLLMDPNRHFIVPEDGWIEALREYTQNDRLFLYYHLQERKYILAAWIFAPGEDGADRGVCLEVEIFDQYPGLGTPIPVAAAFVRSSDEVHKERLQMHRDARSEKLRKNEDGNQERKDLVKHLKKRGHAEEARAIEMGHTPIEVRSETDNVEQYDAACERLQEIAVLAGKSKKALSALKRT